VKRLDVESRARVEQKDALRAAGRRDDAPVGVEPAGGPTVGELALGVAAVALLGLLDRGEEHLLDGALNRADGEALLHDPVGELLVEMVEGVEQPAR
jgi:hypothetical protein